MIQLTVISNSMDSLITSGLFTVLTKSGRYLVDSLCFMETADVSSFHNTLPVLLWQPEFQEEALKAISSIRKTQERLCVLLVTNIDRMQLQMLTRQGKTAVLSVMCSTEVFHQTIQQLVQTHKQWIISPDVVLPLVDELLGVKPSKLNFSLTISEQKILSCAKRGLSIAQTAQELSLSKNTIAAYRSKIVVKAGVNSISEFIAKYYDSF